MWKISIPLSLAYANICSGSWASQLQLYSQKFSSFILSKWHNNLANKLRIAKPASKSKQGTRAVQRAKI